VVSLVPRLTPGSIFAERFRIVAHVGQGSMGSVYRAESTSDGAVVALKIVSLSATLDGRAERRFEREVESGTRIQSPHVARTLASGKLGDSGLAWLAMEFAEGVGADELLRRRGALSLGDARRLLQQLFAAVGVAHREGIVHRDLKPENVRVDAGLMVKVLDFGIATDFVVNNLSGTTPGLGTPLWTAPEQGREGYRPVPASDVWALGLITFFVLTGAPYWRHAGERASMADLAIELLQSELPPASERARELEAGELPPGFDAWFERAVNRDPAARFADADLAWQALEPLLRRDSDLPVAAERQRPSLVVRPGIFVTGVILSCIAAGTVIYWLLHSMRI
jgi:eukaryotic-like serine/threonine-protein kinase